MNTDKLRLAMKAGQKAGLRLHLDKLMSGEKSISRTYNNSGDRCNFNPWVSLDDAMLIALKCCQGFDWSDDFFSVYPNWTLENSALQVARLGGKTDGERIRSICNAIVNAANYRSPS